MTDRLLLHATAIAIDGRALLLRGASGSGKSDLALRLIDAGARLVADDQCELYRRGEEVIVRAPADDRGSSRCAASASSGSTRWPRRPSRWSSIWSRRRIVERLPARQTEAILGLALPRDCGRAVRTSAAAKLRLALRAFTGIGDSRLCCSSYEERRCRRHRHRRWRGAAAGTIGASGRRIKLDDGRLAPRYIEPAIPSYSRRRGRPRPSSGASGKWLLPCATRPIS